MRKQSQHELTRTPRCSSEASKLRDAATIFPSKQTQRWWYNRKNLNRFSETNLYCSKELTVKFSKPNTSRTPMYGRPPARSASCTNTKTWKLTFILKLFVRQHALKDEAHELSSTKERASVKFNTHIVQDCVIESKHSSWAHSNHKFLTSVLNILDWDEKKGIFWVI